MEKFNIRDINEPEPYNEQELMLIDLINQYVATAKEQARNNNTHMAEEILYNAFHFAYALWYMRIVTNSSRELTYIQKYFDKAYQTILNKERPYIA